MEKIELEVYSQSTNQSVVKMPGRRFPGLVIQGDTISIMKNLANSIYEKAKKTSDRELIDEADELLTLLKGFIKHYEYILQKHKIELPYNSSETPGE